MDAKELRKENIDIILEAFCWLKDHGYAYSNAALHALNLELETSFTFLEHDSAYGTNYSIEN